jgi:hypothetical protein
MVFFAMRTTEEITPTLTRKQIHVDEIYMYVTYMYVHAYMYHFNVTSRLKVRCIAFISD